MFPCNNDYRPRENGKGDKFLSLVWVLLKAKDRWDDQSHAPLIHAYLCLMLGAKAIQVVGVWWQMRDDCHSLYIAILCYSKLTLEADLVS